MARPPYTAQPGAAGPAGPEPLVWVDELVRGRDGGVPGFRSLGLRCVCVCGGGFEAWPGLVCPAR